ncbi:MAG TPA: hypothetical protein VJI75_05900 [Candidatus Nanoarchaeia archaeon]|nr:hypothetical protein [Candidatus Nanoarchaeia archaeon]
MARNTKMIRLMCKANKKVGMNCENESECKTIKETGFGVQGPILNIKRICTINNSRDIIRKW